MDLVSEAFKAVKVEGLDRVFVCRICGAIFVSANDSERHIKLYHRIFTKRRLEEVESWLNAMSASSSKQKTGLGFA
jgi:uncharacterized C2H2 Zn-finger protein